MLMGFQKALIMSSCVCPQLEGTRFCPCGRDSTSSCLFLSFLLLFFLLMLLSEFFCHWGRKVRLHDAVRKSHPPQHVSNCFHSMSVYETGRGDLNIFTQQSLLPFQKSLHWHQQNRTVELLSPEVQQVIYRNMLSTKQHCSSNFAGPTGNCVPLCKLGAALRAAAVTPLENKKTGEGIQTPPCNVGVTV